tara:strand:- start:1188 stop:2432 length:1245 start_codon:yes stop_codon:yes gene_type:complete
MSNEGNFDLSGVFQVQKNYLTDLSNSYPNVNNAPVIAKYVLDLQNKVQDVTKSYQDANTSSDNILTQQDDMINIVKTEQDRLLEKKKIIEAAENEEKRKMLLTKSNNLRNEAFTKIILMIILCVTIHIILIVIYKNIVQDPPANNIFTLFVLLHLANFAICTIIAFKMYIDILARSQINFNELDLPPPNTGSSSQAPAIADYNNLFADLGLCYSSSCCGENTKYDTTLGQCVDDNKDQSNNKSPAPAPNTNTPNQEGFRSLDTLPRFKPGTSTSGIYIDDKVTKVLPAQKKEKEFDPINASEEELINKTKENVDNISSDILGSLGGFTGFSDPTAFATNMMGQFGNIDSNALLGKEPDPGVTKCGFTTMEVEMSKPNPIYAPDFKCEFLPKKTTFDSSVYLQGPEKVNYYVNYK